MPQPARTFLSALILATLAGPCLAATAEPSLWERLAGSFGAPTAEPAPGTPAPVAEVAPSASIEAPAATPGGAPELGPILESQRRLEAQEQQWYAAIERSRRTRLMLREAALLATPNVPCVQDQLDHWNCNSAQRKLAELKQRSTELDAFETHLQGLCGGLPASDSAQRQACAAQLAESQHSRTALDALAQRYRTQCAH